MTNEYQVIIEDINLVYYTVKAESEEQATERAISFHGEFEHADTVTKTGENFCEYNHIQTDKL